MQWLWSRTSPVIFNPFYRLLLYSLNAFFHHPISPFPNSNRNFPTHDRIRNLLGVHVLQYVLQFVLQILKWEKTQYIHTGSVVWVNSLSQSCMFRKKNEFSLLQQLNYFQFCLHSFPRNYFQDCQLIMFLVYSKFRYSENY